MKSWLQMDTAARQDRFVTALVGIGLVTTQQHRGKLRRFFNSDINQTELEQGLGATIGTNQAALQSQLAAHHPVLNWSANSGNTFKDFDDIVTEVKSATPIISSSTNSELHSVLDRIYERRANRNRFFHDQNQTGLTVDDYSCLNALTDLYKLCELLFGNEYHEQLNLKTIVRAQIIAIKLKKYGAQTGAALIHYREILKQRGTIQLSHNDFGHEFYALHEDARNFHQRLRRYFEDGINVRQGKISQIEGLTRRNIDRQNELDILKAQVSMFEEILNECF
jgi:hypothetical protein